MLHILLLLLKIIGFVLLLVLGIILTIVLLILFVPLRYRGNGSLYERPVWHIKFTWLLHLIVFQIEYDGTLKTTAKILGIRLFRDSGTSENAEDFEDESSDYVQGESGFLTDGEDMILSAQEIKEEDRDLSEKLTERADGGRCEYAAEQTEDSKRDAFPVRDISPEERNKKTASGRKKQKISFIGRTAARIKSRIKKVFHRLRQRIYSLPANIRSFILRIKGALENMEKTAEKVKGYYRKAALFWEDEENRKTLALIKKEFSRLLLHLKPVRLEGNITFGLEDPCLMGQILSAAALFYPLYGKQLEICPVFDEKILEGEIRIRGRLRLGTILFICIRLLLDRNLRNLFRKYMNRGGD